VVTSDFLNVKRGWKIKEVQKPFEPLELFALL
jgi:hypothetical protein